MDKKYETQVLKYQEQILQFGINVKKMRAKKGWTQLELANLSNLDIRTIQRIENGQITIKMPIIFVLAEAFGAPVTNLFRNIDV
jgi:transcriptional regulator with XRE-family HTH domain